MAFGRIIKNIFTSARLLTVAPALFLGTVAMATPAAAEPVGAQTCTVFLFFEVCTADTPGASPAPAPMMGGSLLSLAALGGFVALRCRAALKVQAEDAAQPTLEG